MLESPVRTGSRRPSSGSMNTDTAARPSEYTSCPTGRDSPSRRLSSLVKAGQLAAELPAGEARRRGSAVLDAPAAGGLPGLHHVAAHRADGELREHELLDRVAARIERDGLQQHAAVHVGVELVAVAQIVLRREHHRLAVEAGDAVVLAEADVIVARERAHALGQQRREIALGGAAIDLDHPALRQVAADAVARTHDLARHAVQHLELVDVAAGVDVARDARGLGAPAVLVDEGAAVGELLRRVLDLAQPAERFRRLRLGQARGQGDEHTDRPATRHFVLSCAESDTVRT